MYCRLNLLILAGLSTLAVGYEIPSKLRDIYNKHKSGHCTHKAASGFGDGANDNKSVSYCEDIPNAIYLHSYLDGGRYADMDIDCDGADRLAGRCGNDPTGQDQTSFKDQLQQYGISDLNSNIHPYVVFGNVEDTPSFKPQDRGMLPLSVMAVICNNQLFYGIWGDFNGGTLTGESSLSMADLCFPEENLSGDKGHTGHDVLYIGFKGQHAVPGSSANWKASNTKEFEASIKDLGDELVAQLCE